MAKEKIYRGNYPTVDLLQNKIDEYFKHCDKGKPSVAMKRGFPMLNKDNEPITIHTPIPYTIQGLIVFLGYGSNNAIYELKKRGSKWRDAIIRARKVIETNRIERALLGEVDSKIATLDLITNFGYTQKQEIQHSGNVQIDVKDSFKKGK